MNDLSGTATATAITGSSGPIPRVVPRILFPLFVAGLAASIFILVVVHNALLLGFLILVSSLVTSFLLWNLYGFKSNRAVLHFLDRFPASDLSSAQHGQLVKITGLVSCGTVSLESSYEKVERCVYTSTILYEHGKSKHAICRCFTGNLTYIERYATDFYIMDMKSGARVLVKAGDGSKVIPLVQEGTIVKTTRRDRQLSSTLKKWLRERNLSPDGGLLQLQEGYVREGNSLTVLGMLSRSNDALMIAPPVEPVAAGCLLQKFLLPIDIDGLVVCSDTSHC